MAFKQDFWSILGQTIVLAAGLAARKAANVRAKDMLDGKRTEHRGRIRRLAPLFSPRPLNDKRQRQQNFAGEEGLVLIAITFSLAHNEVLVGSMPLPADICHAHGVATNARLCKARNL